MSDGSGDIIIKGGSVQLEFNDKVYPPNNGHKNDELKITKVVITGDINFSSDDFPAGAKCTITVTCK
jgi:hypothetical protein